MPKYAVFSDSACDLPVSITKKHDIEVVPFTVSFDKENRLTEGVDINNDTFYRMLEASSAMPKTYYPTVGVYVERFKKRLEQGQDIICLCLSSKLSKSYASAMNAKKILSYTYPNNKIMVIDTMLASVSQGLLALSAARLREDTDTESACARLETAKKSALSIVTVASLEQLARGGRMSNTTAAIGKLLKINPIIYMENGLLVSKNKAMGRQKALDLLIKLAAAEIGNRPDHYDIGMMHSRARTEANYVENELKIQYGFTQAIPPVELGLTIGMHTGASVVAVAFVKKV